MIQQSTHCFIQSVVFVCVSVRARALYRKCNIYLFIYLYYWIFIKILYYNMKFSHILRSYYETFSNVAYVYSICVLSMQLRSDIQFSIRLASVQNVVCTAYIMGINVVLMLAI